MKVTLAVWNFSQSRNSENKRARLEPGIRLDVNQKAYSAAYNVKGHRQSHIAVYAVKVVTSRTRARQRDVVTTDH